jgi:predicted kinase
MNRKRVREDDQYEIECKRLKNQKCAIILMGLPGSGKTYLTTNIINHINDSCSYNYSFTNFNPDNVSITRNLDKKKELSTKCKIITKKLSNMFKSNNSQSFIFDGTGSNKSMYNFIIKNCKQLDYKIYIVYVKTDLEKALKRNDLRFRKVDVEFIRKYSTKIDQHFDYYKNQDLNYLVIDNNQNFIILDKSF